MNKSNQCRDKLPQSMNYKFFKRIAKSIVRRCNHHDYGLDQDQDQDCD